MTVLSTRRAKAITAGLLIALVIAGGFLWWRARQPGPRMVHTSEGYGGLVPATSERARKPLTPLQWAAVAYNKGRYKEAEATALKIVDSASSGPSPSKRKEAVRARYLLAFSAARRKDMRLARERFDTLREEAGRLPDNGKQSPPAGHVDYWVPPCSVTCGPSFRAAHRHS